MTRGPMRKFWLIFVPVATAAAVAYLRVAYANSPYDLLGEPHFAAIRCLGHALLAAGLWLVRNRYRSYLRSALGPMAQSFKPMLRMCDPAVLALACLFTLYALVPIFPALIPYVAPLSVVAGVILFMVIFAFWRARASIAHLLGRES